LVLVPPELTKGNNYPTKCWSRPARIGTQRHLTQAVIVGKKNLPHWGAEDASPPANDWQLTIALPVHDAAKTRARAGMAVA
jgi:hypothetical protein